MYKVSILSSLNIFYRTMYPWVRLEHDQHLEHRWPKQNSMKQLNALENSCLKAHGSDSKWLLCKTWWLASKNIQRLCTVDQKADTDYALIPGTCAARPAQDRADKLQMALSSAHNEVERASTARLRSLDLTQDARDERDSLGGRRWGNKMNKERLGMTRSL